MGNLDSANKKTIEEEEFVYTNWDKLKLFGFVFSLLAFVFYTRSCIGPRKFGAKFNCHTIEIYYKDNVTEKEVTRLCTNLRDSREGAKGVSIQLSKKDNTYVVKFVIIEEMQAEQDIVSTLESLASDFSKDVFENKPVEVHICDAGFNTVTVLYSVD